MTHIDTMPTIKKGELPPPPEKQRGVLIRKGELPAAPSRERARGYAPEPDPAAAKKKFAPRVVK